MSPPIDTTAEIQRRAGLVEAWLEQGRVLAKGVDLNRKDGTDLVYGCAGLLTALAARRFPYARAIETALADVLMRSLGILIGARHVGMARPGPDGARASAGCAEAGGRMDIEYALLAESDRGVIGSCPQRVWDLLYRSPAGTTDYYEPRDTAIACRGCGAAVNVECARKEAT